MARILALGGDGIGPEILQTGLVVAQAASSMDLHITHELLHGACWDQHGVFIRDETLQAAEQADAILVGAVGGLKWDNIRVDGWPETQDGLMRLRHELQTYAGLRPARHWHQLAGQTPFRHGLAEGANIMVLH